MTIKANPIYISSKKEAETFISKFDNFLLDCDGVIWLAENLIKGVPQFLDYLIENNKQFAFVTNNSSKSRDSYIEKFKNLGIKIQIPKNRIYTTSFSAVLELKTLNIHPGSKIWVLGDEGIEDELKDQGYIPLGGSNSLLDKSFDPENPLFTIDDEVKAIIVGSTNEFNFMRISTTLQYLMFKNKSLPFIGINSDRFYNGPNNLFLPAAGSICEIASYSSNRKYINVGKPSSVFAREILRDTGFNKHKTVMIGDTMSSDIRFGNYSHLGDGQGTLLVLSGVTKFDHLKTVLDNPNQFDDVESLIPRFYTDSLTKLITLLTETE
ncbi:unnamed protein product [Candida verbasci]|uniref:4-nitrophenylphosphatase n=1 Tax=Candida verbasci TaxID=1227364 RepID=A0A9W4TVX7_9ASCO|nr:unnamed protein product [Candida verbasci]